MTIFAKLSNLPARRLLASSRFKYLWAGQVVSQIGDGLNKVALLWFVYNLTGSAIDMTLVGVLQSLPPLLLSPFLGVFIDRLPKKPLLISIDLARAVLIALIPVLYLLGALNLPVIYALTFANAVVAAAFGPAMAASIPQLVRAEEFTAANGLIHSATTAGVLVGPALGGLLAAFIGAQNVLYVDAATFVFSAACLSFLRLAGDSTDLTRSLDDVQVFGEIKQGLHFIFARQPMIAWLMGASAVFAAGIGAFPIMLPIFAKAQLHVGSVWLGWIWSALGAGMVSMTIGLAVVKNTSARTNLLIMGGGSAVAALATLSLSLVSGPHPALVITAVIGASTALFTPLLWTLLQNYTMASVRGRIFTLIGTVDMTASTLAMGMAGLLAEYAGPSTSLRMLALLFLGAAALIAFIVWHSRPRYTTLASSAANE